MRTVPIVEEAAGPGWPERLRLLLPDLVAFDPHRVSWVLALRTVLGLAMPLLAAHAFHQPQLLWTGLGAYLLAIGDCIDDGDRAQPLRIIVGALLGSFALATGVLAGFSQHLSGGTHLFPYRIVNNGHGWFRHFAPPGPDVTPPPRCPDHVGEAIWQLAVSAS
jgi:hypothetical protein